MTAAVPGPRSAPRSEGSRVRRLPQRAAYDDATIHAILDEGVVGHVGFIAAGEPDRPGRPVVIPMLYGRDGDAVYLHGSVASRLLRTLSGGIDVCLTVTLIDGLVMARSAFHHSMNYRSVVTFGRAEPAEGARKEHGLRVISEHLAPGRWDEVRPPTGPELRQTCVLRMEIEEATAKIRTGDPVDDEEDLALDVWAGVVPCALAWGDPVPAADLDAGVALSPSLSRSSSESLSPSLSGS